MVNVQETGKVLIYTEKARTRSVPEETKPLLKRNPWIAVGVLGLAVIGACVVPAPIVLRPSESERHTPVAATASETAAPTRTATLAPSSIPTWTGTEILEATLTSLPAYIMDARGVPMAYVPAGVFLMGSDRGRFDEYPIHPVDLEAFYIDRYEVTNDLYKACVDAGVCQPVRRRSSATRTSYYDNRRYIRYPVIFVDWHTAQTYCETWREARLPTEAEWEKAARGGTDAIYPWGDVPDCNLANYGNCLRDTSGVTIYNLGASRYGLHHMAGNVWEWVSDWYSDDYYRSSPEENPQGPDTGTEKVLRGGSWKDDYAEIRSMNREAENPLHSSHLIGFRCARDADP
jgi:formylglycine-generating enzyme